MYFAIIGSNLTCCRENFKCHWSKNSYHVDNFSKSGVVTELVLTAIETEAFADKHSATTRAHARTTIDFLPATKPIRKMILVFHFASPHLLQQQAILNYSEELMSHQQHLLRTVIF